MKTINDWVAECHQLAVEKGWWKEERNFGEMLALIHSEISEALDEHRNHHGFTEVYYNPEKPTKPEGIPVELGDAVIRIFDLFGQYEVDVESVLELKMAYNRTRAHRHGNKAC